MCNLSCLKDGKCRAFMTEGWYIKNDPFSGIYVIVPQHVIS